MNFLGTTLTGPLAVGCIFAAICIIVALFLTLYRLVKGETLADRVVALDLMSMLLTALFVLLALAVEFSAYLDTALVLSLISFLATVAFARYIERMVPRRPGTDTEEDG